MKMKKFLLAIGVSVALFALTGCGEAAQNNVPQNGNEAVTANSNVDIEDEGLPLDMPVIIMGLDDTFAPMGFRDENNELVGFDIDLANATSEILDIPIEFQPIDWTTKETELKNGNIDVIWNGYSVSNIRKEMVNFTDEYMVNRQVVVTLFDSEIDNLADLEGKTVAVQAESSAVSAVASVPEIASVIGEVVEFSSNNECLLDLEAGRTDAVVADEILIRYYISKKGEARYKILEENFGVETYAVGVRKEDTALLNSLNTALDTIKVNGVGEEISEKWFGENILAD